MGGQNPHVAPVLYQKQQISPKTKRSFVFKRFRRVKHFCFAGKQKRINPEKGPCWGCFDICRANPESCLDAGSMYLGVCLFFLVLLFFSPEAGFLSGRQTRVRLCSESRSGRSDR